MSNHSFVIDPAAASGVQPGDTVQLGGEEAHHAVTVKRVSPGEQLDLVDGSGTRLVVEVSHTAKEALQATVLEVHHEPAPAHPVTLVQALAKNDRDLQAVESCVELGASAVRPWQAERSIVRWNGPKAAKALAKWRSQVRAAQKQSRRAFEPQVHELSTSKQLAAQIRTATQAGELVLVLHEAAGQSAAQLAAAWLPGAAEGAGIQLVVGPEGGISDAELELFTAAGAQPALLGRHVLRASTAGPAALVLVRHLAGEI